MLVDSSFSFMKEPFIPVLFLFFKSFVLEVRVWAQSFKILKLQFMFWQKKIQVPELLGQVQKLGFGSMYTPVSGRYLNCLLSSNSRVWFWRKCWRTHWELEERWWEIHWELKGNTLGTRGKMEKKKKKPLF
jgi:hypothetical protein